MQTKLTITAFAFTLTLFSMCKTEEEEATGIDKQLFDEATSSTGFTYYKNNPDILASSQPSAHNAFMRVRFNPIALSALDSTGRLPLGSSFPNGSLIVKELYNSQVGEPVLYAIMKKDSANENSGANWLWAEIKPDGLVVVSATRKGASCVNCHNMNSRDYTRIFDLF